jgi:hypothetical protein
MRSRQRSAATADIHSEFSRLNNIVRQDINEFLTNGTNKIDNINMNKIDEKSTDSDKANNVRLSLIAQYINIIHDCYGSAESPRFIWRGLSLNRPW